MACTDDRRVVQFLVDTLELWRVEATVEAAGAPCVAVVQVDKRAIAWIERAAVTNAMVHTHGHFHVTHNHNRMAGGFDHLSSYHEHEHDHARLIHRHYPHEDFEREHHGEAHVHDHATPVRNGKARKATKATKKTPEPAQTAD